ncbi:MAG: hypothetical protein HOV68_32105 [Streptomycetaceae bacterium]|nr:hypothetical protein [Streptomycetaceae bacterium]
MSLLLRLDDWDDRLAEIAWVVDHLDDLHADFLAIWGINLDRDEPPPGWRFFPMCRRTFAYPGVMAALLAEEDRRHEAQTDHRPVPTPARRAPAAGQQPREVSLEEIQRMHPDLIDH